MNWYKKAQVQETLPYFQVFEQYGEYVPDFDLINDKLKENFNTIILKEIGRGDSGIAYLLSNGDILKITTNAQEGQIAKWMQNNPNPNIIDYKVTWDEGDLTCIIMDYIPEPLHKYQNIYDYIKSIEYILNEQKCYDVQCAIDILKSDNRLKKNPYLLPIINYLTHLSKSPFKMFDFINSNNIGIKDGKIVFFDIT